MSEPTTPEEEMPPWQRNPLPGEPGSPDNPFPPPPLPDGFTAPEQEVSDA